VLQLSREETEAPEISQALLEAEAAAAIDESEIEALRATLSPEERAVWDSAREAEREEAEEAAAIAEAADVADAAAAEQEAAGEQATG
jgi:hypothetical protein